MTSGREYHWCFRDVNLLKAKKDFLTCHSCSFLVLDNPGQHAVGNYRASSINFTKVGNPTIANPTTVNPTTVSSPAIVNPTIQVVAL